MIDLKNRSPEEVNKILNDAWMGLVFNDETLYNPLAVVPKELEENPHLYYTWLISQPEYFSLVCSEFLNVNLLPFQCVILRNMWKYKFPMLIASRGLGKTFLLAVYTILRLLLIPDRQVVVAGSGFRQSKLVYEYCCKIWNNAPLLRNCVFGYPGHQGPKGGHDAVYLYIGSSKATFVPVGCLHPDSLVTTKNGIKTIGSLKDNISSVYGDGKQRDVGFFYDSGISPSYKVRTKLGYEYVGTPNHKMKIVRNNKIEWVRTDEIILGDKILIDRSERWFESSFNCSKDEAYCLGLMLGDGCYTIKNILRYTTIDKEFVEILNNSIGIFRPQSDGVHYNLSSKKIKNKWMDFWGLKSLKSYEKYLPDSILSSSKENMASCISGLFDTDGHCYSDISKGGISSSINYTTTSKKLAYQVQYILLHFGIVSNIRHRDRLSPRTGNKAHRVYALEKRIQKEVKKKVDVFFIV